MSVPTLTEAEKVLIRHHAGYLNVRESSIMAFGVPSAIQPLFWIEGAMDRLKPEAIPLVQRLLGWCEQIEAQMFANAENQAVTSIGDISINKDEFEELRTKPLDYARKKLVNALGVIVNPHDPTNQGGINVGVSTG